MADVDRPGDDGARFLRFEGMPPLSERAFQLHSFASVRSVKDGHPGFVSDEYLSDLALDTTTTALELETAGMWRRREGGYFVISDEMVKMIIEFHEQRDRERAECAERGTHLPSGMGRRSGWMLCGHCGIPLERPDGGPVALPDGGPLPPE